MALNKFLSFSPVSRRQEKISMFYSIDCIVFFVSYNNANNLFLPIYLLTLFSLFISSSSFVCLFIYPSIPIYFLFPLFFQFCFLPCLAEIKGRVVRNEVFINGSSSKVVSQRQVVRSRITITNMVCGESSRVPTSLRAEQGRQQVVRSQVDSTSGS